MASRPALTTLLSGFARFAANNAWRGSEWAGAQLLPHAGKTLRVEVWPLSSFVLRVSAEGAWEDVGDDFSPAATAAPDATLRITPSLAAKLAQLPDKPGAALDLTGDAAFVAALRDLHDVLPLALDDRLSEIAGPIAAHALSTALRSLAAWPRLAAGRVGAGAAAYLTEEAPLLLKRQSFRTFTEELETLAERTEGLISNHAL